MAGFWGCGDYGVVGILEVLCLYGKEAKDKERNWATSFCIMVLL
jgi:hypothetical protein